MSYSYDDLGRLVSASYDGALAIVYEYDASGNIIRIATQVSTDAPGANEPAGVPAVLALGPIAPNPSEGASRIRYQLPRPTKVSLAVFDATGRRVRLLANSEQPAGYYAATWDGRNEAGLRAPSGIYFLRLDTGAERKIQSAVVLR